VRSSEKWTVCFLRRAWKHNGGNGSCEIAPCRRASNCVNRKTQPVNESTAMTSSSESEAGPTASQ